MANYGLGAFADSFLQAYRMKEDMDRKKRDEEREEQEREDRKAYASAVGEAAGKVGKDTPYQGGDDQALNDPQFGLKAAYSEGMPVTGRAPDGTAGLRNEGMTMDEFYRRSLSAAGDYNQADRIPGLVTSYMQHKGQQADRDWRREQAEENLRRFEIQDRRADSAEKRAQAAEGRSASSHGLNMQSTRAAMTRAEAAEQRAVDTAARTQAKHDADMTRAEAVEQRAVDTAGRTQAKHDAEMADQSRLRRNQALVDFSRVLDHGGAAAGNRFIQNYPNALKAMNVDPSGDIGVLEHGPGQFMIVSKEMTADGQEVVQQRPITPGMLRGMAGLKPVEPKIIEIYDEEEGRKRKMMVDPVTRELKPVGGVEAPKADTKLYELEENVRTGEKKYGTREQALSTSQGDPMERRNKARLQAEADADRIGPGLAGAFSGKSERDYYGGLSKSEWTDRREQQLLGNAPAATAQPAGKEKKTAAAPSGGGKSAAAFVQAAVAKGFNRDKAIAKAKQHIKAGRLTNDLDTL